jgi:hypothetical protein
MTSFLIHCLILTSYFAGTASPTLLELRRLYYEAPESSRSSELFMEKVHHIDTDSNPAMLCYKGMAYMVRANHVFNPYSKLSYFIKGKAMMEKSVKCDPENVEIRFLRYCAQTNAPMFLGYFRDIDEDKSIILAKYGSLTDTDLKERIKNYLLRSRHCTDDEKTILL